MHSSYIVAYFLTKLTIPSPGARFYLVVATTDARADARLGLLGAADVIDPQ